MQEELLRQLSEVSKEEEEILAGKTDIDQSRYSNTDSFVVDGRKLIGVENLMEIRTHTRFVQFPKHRHNYVEMIYMCQGQTVHIINDKKIILKQGELLILNPNAVQEIFPARREDIAVNFIILPEFFDRVLLMLGTTEHLIRDFLINAISSRQSQIEYLHFHVSDVCTIQNLIENLVLSLVSGRIKNNRLNQVTMGLLFLELMNVTDRIESEDSKESGIIFQVLTYVNGHYRQGSLKELAVMLNYDICYLSKLIKNLTGKNYTELVQNQRLEQSKYLLEMTDLSVADIAASVGYENISYFYRIFTKCEGCSPKSYRNKYK